MLVNKSLTVSCFDMIGPAMIGPSSSHTAGACRIGNWARKISGSDTVKVKFILYGSFANTWRGHGTDRALLAGVMGIDVSDPRIRDAYVIADNKGIEYSFIEDKNTITDHPNTVRIELESDNGNCVSVVGESIGGGRAKIIQIDGISVKFNGRLNSMLVYQKDKPGLLAHIANCCAKRKINIAFLNLFRSETTDDAFTLVEADNCIPNDLIMEIKSHPLVSQVMILENNIIDKNKNEECNDKTSQDKLDRSKSYIFSSAKELMDICKDENISVAELMIRREIELSDKSRDEIISSMEYMWNVMKSSITEALNNKRISIGKLIGGEGKKVLDSLEKENIYLGVGSKAISYALAVLEQNASMGLIVAAPTAGASGVLPACLKSTQEEFDYTDEQIVESLFVAAAVAFLIQLGFSLSGAEGGCQAEVGSASAMASAALTYLAGGTTKMQFDSASISLMNLLGLVCDPVAGLVELPCQLRNANGSITAMNSVQMVMAGIESLIPFDEMVEVCNKVGNSLPASLRETAMGGVAASPTACSCAACIFS